jgi:hypothetical protein
LVDGCYVFVLYIRTFALVDGRCMFALYDCTFLSIDRHHALVSVRLLQLMNRVPHLISRAVIGIRGSGFETHVDLMRSSKSHLALERLF